MNEKMEENKENKKWWKKDLLIFNSFHNHHSFYAFSPYKINQDWLFKG